MPRKTKQSKQKEKRSRFWKRRKRSLDEPLATDLIEEGVHLLRVAPLSGWAIYLSGMVPFIVGFLFFWTEMATSGLAGEVLFPASLGMALLFVWLKWTQAYFARGLHGALYGGEPRTWSFADSMRVLRRQTIWQATGLLVLPIAFVVTIPFAWAFAFYQNMLAADPLDDPEHESVFAVNWRLARIWNEQNWMLLSLFGLVALLSWINWISMVFFVPFLGKSLLGIDSVLANSGGLLFNSTTIFACLMLAYAVTDPLVKASYLLRRHYCHSRRSGADLALRLQQLQNGQRAGGKTAALIIALLLSGALFTPNQSFAEDPAPTNVQIESSELDSVISEVLERREFVWRFPRESVEEEGQAVSWFRDLIESIEKFQEQLELWIEEFFGREPNERKKSSSSWLDGDFTGLGTFLSYLVIGIFVLLVIWFAFRAWKSYGVIEAAEASPDASPVAVPDLEDEEVSADLLPRNRWIEMARELIARGDYRLALRAYFLAQLSEFASEGLIVIRRAKSNREYAQELSRRGHGRENLLEVYRRQVRLFEDVWYGGHESGPEQIEQMEACLVELGVTL